MFISAAGDGERFHCQTVHPESELDRVMERFPEVLPIDELNESFAHPVCVISQFEVRGKGNRLDLLMINAQGRITIVESKLEKNPEATRKVLAQAIDYAATIHAMGYEEFSKACGVYADKKRSAPKVAHHDDPLLELVRLGCDEVIDADAFRKQVTRDLELGRFLIVIVGDAIKDKLIDMVEFLNEHSQLGFELAVVELRHFQSDHGSLIVPRLVQSVQRTFVAWEPDRASPAAQVFNRENSTGSQRAGSRGTSVPRLEQQEATIEFAKRIRDRLGHSDGEVVLNATDGLVRAACGREYIVDYVANAVRFQVELEDRLTLFAIDSKGTIGHTGCLRKYVTNSNAPDSIWLDFWNGISALSQGAGALIPNAQSETLNTNIFRPAGKLKSQVPILDVLGMNNERIDPMLDLLDTAFEALSER